MRFMQRLDDAGLTASMVGERLRLTPAEGITVELRAYIAASREALIAELRDDRRHCRGCAHYRCKSVLVGTCRAWTDQSLRDRVSTTTGEILDDLPRRCGAFTELPAPTPQAGKTRSEK